jgi:hypothetical protein
MPPVFGLEHGYWNSIGVEYSLDKVLKIVNSTFNLLIGAVDVDQGGQNLTQSLVCILPWHP